MKSHKRKFRKNLRHKSRNTGNKNQQRGYHPPSRTKICMLFITLCAILTLIAEIYFSLFSSKLFGLAIISFDEQQQMKTTNISSINSSFNFSPNHTAAIADYYPFKTSKLFTKYIVLDNDCGFELIKRNETNQSNEYFESEQMKKFGSKMMLSNESDIALNFDSFHCEQLMTVHSNFIWKISFDIEVHNLEYANNEIKDFELFVTAQNNDGQIRSVGRVNDGHLVKMNDDFVRIHNADFYIYESSLVHTIEVLYSYPDRAYDFSSNEKMPDIIDNIERLRNEFNDNLTAIFEHMRNETLFNFNLSKDDEAKIAKNDFGKTKFIGSYLYDTPLQIKINANETNNVHRFCFEEPFHFDVSTAWKQKSK